ncbi:MAG: ATP-binding protein, partial [Lachnospiraceae bacterium]|nr:ATP-binding protein [Lachnospiraceae bacterium]
MAFCTVLSASVQGLGVEMIRVEADVSNGLPMFHMVGYLSSEVKEASERVRTAIRNSGMKLPAKKIIVNLAPATVRKKGASFDLPIALAVLAAMGYIPEEAMERVIVTGELSLEGKIRGVPGVLPMVIEAKEQGCKSFILPGENETEGRLVKGIEILPADNLEELCAYLNGAARSEKSKREKKENEKNRQHRAREDFADICGQKAVKRAAEIAVAGGHNLLMAGSPGSGKTMIAKRIATILPELSW